ncbi:bifunctional diaminohydroxyphosphoribosylaminopyrimidine deaminase/5-amino-6-(5-phosphoribosylamino)uracil reductase RibD [Phytohalomonas tamaricis]|uniref:bifunctional diaminohydroxyphosphoribosylaminopyrimidine deaminase/5-amino-6-(5-phosphoribosylamino)uracil reductase RibD n=1 Tax=Phytohalomonas tamaricis TaxID=2081032 RepID=UPI000D0B354A|nr:bifunctional diaminohydroxyphosphoribosylaminopyrimidine deaminase/5-amino-6-(5-phosphoribosylamino)uracil reductase RibD [Phytohalomonas tamaricis]
MISSVPERYMARALELARRGLFTTDPNPRVGCVIVKDAHIVGEGYHLRTGEPHAEIHALNAAGEQARGATAYVTLEPCAHYGRTGPCALALAEAGIVRVVAAMKDPNPLVAGRGFAILEEAGVAVEYGLLEHEARQLNPGFISRMARGRPYVRLKMAMSLDGRTAMASGESQWITGAEARREVQRLRARSSAVMTGIDSILYDDSRLTVRAEQLGCADAETIAMRQPLRVVVDSRLRMPLAANCLTQPGRTLIATAQQGNNERRERLLNAGAEVIELPDETGERVDLAALMSHLAQHEGCNEVLLETGATLAGAMLDAELIDEMHLFMAPALLGGQARPLFALSGMTSMTQQRRLDIDDIRAVGKDWRIIARPI